MNVESRATNLIYLSNVPDVDIKRYLIDCFRKIREAHPRRAALPIGDWPEDHQVNTLVKLSSGKFIYPVTAMRYVSSPHHIPTDRLLEVLTNAMLGGGLKALYSMIINKIENFFEVARLLGFIAISGRDFCLTPRRLEEQLFLNQGDVRRLIFDLDPFVEFVDEETPIRFWHPSFSNFLLGPASPTGHYLDPGMMHNESVRLCIRHLKRFHETGTIHSIVPPFDHLTNSIHRPRLGQLPSFCRIFRRQHNRAFRESRTSRWIIEIRDFRRALCTMSTQVDTRHQACISTRPIVLPIFIGSKELGKTFVSIIQLF